MRKNEEEQGAKLIHYGKTVLLGGALAFLFCLIFLFMASAAISQGLLDAALRYQLTVVSCVLGGFTGGLFAVHRCLSRALFVGLAVGGVLFLLQLTIGLLIYDTMSMENGGFGLLFAALCGGAAAGVLGSGKKSGKGRGKKRKGR